MTNAHVDFPHKWSASVGDRQDLDYQCLFVINTQLCYTMLLTMAPAVPVFWSTKNGLSPQPLSSRTCQQCANKKDMHSGRQTRSDARRDLSPVFQALHAFLHAYLLCLHTAGKCASLQH